MRYCFIILLFLISTKHYAQQMPMYSEYMFDKAVINPAYTGTTPFLIASACHRSQYVGLEGAPITQYFTVQMPIQAKNIGIGIKSVNDKVGPINNTQASVMFAYYIGLAGGRLSLGLDAGIINQSLNFSNLVRKDKIDLALANDLQSIIVPDVNFGIYYQTKNFFTGWTSSQMTGSKIKYTNYERSSYYRLWNHNYFIMGYNFGISNSLRFEPSVFVKHVSAAPLQFDFNGRFLIKNIIGTSVSYRTKDAIAFMLDVLIKDQFKIGFGYDKTISGLSNFSNGSYEIMVSYRRKMLPPAKEKEIHPRYYIY